MQNLGTFTAIGAGGALGALGRYWLSTAIYAVAGTAFPWGTLTVNVAGSFLMGLLHILLVERLNLPVEMRALLLVGFLGAFTTFSTFSLETLNLMEQGVWIRAALNIIASVTVCVAAAAAGMFIGRLV